MFRLFLLSLFVFGLGTSSFSFAKNKRWEPSYLKNDKYQKYLEIADEKKKKLPPRKIIPKKSAQVDQLKKMLKQEALTPGDFRSVKKQIIDLKGSAVPMLIEVMKQKDFPDKSRWLATFMLGQIVGKRAAPFLAKFVEHPYWLMRMASLKVLQKLKQKKYSSLYAKALEDNSMMVRRQALETIGKLNLTSLAPQVWKMMYDKKNYTQGKQGKYRRTNIIKAVIKTLGDLKYQKVSSQLLKMAHKPKYTDIFPALDYSLTKILGKSSPRGSLEAKRKFWVALNK